MAKENQLWGAVRIRGELSKLGIRVSKRTVQRYLPKDRKNSGQTWASFQTGQFPQGPEPQLANLGDIDRYFRYHSPSYDPEKGYGGFHGGSRSHPVPQTGKWG